MTSKLLRHWNKSGKIFQFRENSIFYRFRGKGEVLVLLHGFPTASWDWHRVWPLLEGRFKLLAPDFIGFGLSAKPVHYPYRIQDQADLVEQLLDHLKIRRCHLLAHDYGDSVAQELLARFQERKTARTDGLTIASICFLNGGLFPETHRPRMVQKLLLSPLGGLVARLMTRRGFGKSFSAIFGPDTKPSQKELETFWELVKNNKGKRIAHHLIKFIPERKKYRSRWVDAMFRAKIPMRVINGPLDPVSGVHMAKRYRNLIPEADVVVLDGIGHYPHTENPEAVARYYLEFHKRNAKKLKKQQRADPNRM